MRKGRVVFLATSSKGCMPNLIAAEFCGLCDDKILIADCHFSKTLANLKENPTASILLTNNKEYFQLKGTSEYLISGKYFDKVCKICEGTSYKAKGAVLISINEIYDLNTYEKLL